MFGGCLFLKRMTIINISEAQRKAAKVVGLVYLLAMIPAVFAEFYVPAQLINYGDAAATAHNIAANERLFRLGIAANLFVWILDVVLITALYVILEPVNRNLALLAAFWRVIETAILIVVPLSDLNVLRILSGAEYLRGLEAEQLQVMARLWIGTHSSAYDLGVVFLGLGSTVFCYLWFKSGFVPRALAGFGVFASFLLGTCAFAFIVFPELQRLLDPGYIAPMFFFEVGMGLWLLLQGIRAPGTVDDD